MSDQPAQPDRTSAYSMALCDWVNARLPRPMSPALVSYYAISRAVATRNEDGMWQVAIDDRPRLLATIQSALAKKSEIQFRLGQLRSRGRTRKTSDDDVAQIRGLRIGGMPIKTIASGLGLSPAHIGWLCRGIPRPKKTTAADVVKIKQRRAAGHKARDIAHDFDITPGHVHRLCRRRSEAE